MKYFFRCIPIVIASFALLGCQEETPQKEMIRMVRAVQVSDPAEFANRWFPGQAKATQEVDLSFRVAGPVIRFPVNVGDEVPKGQELARIDPRDFEVEVRNVQGQLEREKAVLKRAEADYERVVRIKKQDPGAVSQSLIDRNRQLVDSTRANIRSLQASVASARDKLSYTYLKAPFNGIVTSTYVENYEDVKAKQPIVRLIDHSQIEMIVNIPEDMIYQTDYLKAAGKALIVRFDTFPDREIEAEIKEIGKEASKTTRTYPVTLIMDQPEDVKILPGMAGKATRAVAVPEMKDQPGMVIPETAVFSPEDTDTTFVWVIDDQKKTAGKREVKTGELLDTGIAITGGLKPGEWIATAGVHYLQEGQQVRIQSESSKEVSK
ncbi:MAG: efflux RND transporter periplasmic adaptor subunit [Deltaproteobacteria bacterium]|jgi:RND family efflux transporter MFP subunit|nr:efflux RND transporter periplasmic adaptor subunit [Deltaproteobacteria bacterium]